jgi:hypothetical protein
MAHKREAGLYVREEIKQLEKMGPLPSYEVAMPPDNSAELERYTRLILSIQKPITDEEARALVSLFGPDDCFELEETLVHLIESAPGWPLWDCLEDTSNEWIQTLRRRLENTGITSPSQ